MNRNEQPLWLEYKAKAARKKADYWDARARDLEGKYQQAMVRSFPWAYDENDELLPEGEWEAACRADVREWMADVHSTA